MMTISRRLNSLVSLGKQLTDLTSAEFSDVFEKAATDNPWFTKDNIKSSLAAIRDQYLNPSALETWWTDTKSMITLYQKKWD